MFVDKGNIIEIQSNFFVLFLFLTTNGLDFSDILTDYLPRYITIVIVEVSVILVMRIINVNVS